MAADLAVDILIIDICTKNIWLAEEQIAGNTCEEFKAGKKSCLLKLTLFPAFFYLTNLKQFRIRI